MADIQHEIGIAAGAAKVCAALSTAEGIRRWWTEDADLDEFVGGLGVFRFNYEGVVETVVRIVKLEPDLVCWLVESSFRPEQKGTTINFELAADHGMTKIYFKQMDFKTRDQTLELMEKGWLYYLTSLKRLLETGTGAPSPNIDWSILNDDKTMDQNPEFRCELTVAYPPETLFEAIGNVHKWWVSDVSGPAKNLNDLFTVRMGSTWVKFRISEMVPDQKVVWQVIDCELPWNASDRQEWNGTSLLFELAPVIDGTKLTFSHLGLAPLDCAAQCEKAWSSYIGQSLFNFVTTGTGLPNKF